MIDSKEITVGGVLAVQQSSDRPITQPPSASDFFVLSNSSTQHDFIHILKCINSLAGLTKLIWVKYFNCQKKKRK